MAIKQTGWFGPQQVRTAAETPSNSTPAAPRTATESPVAQHSAPVTSSSAPVQSARSVALPAMRDYSLGSATFTLLEAEVSRHTTEKDALHVRLRMMNNDRFDANFWDRSLRLIVNGVPMAPESTLTNW